MVQFSAAHATATDARRGESLHDARPFLTVALDRLAELRGDLLDGRVERLNLGDNAVGVGGGGGGPGGGSHHQPAVHEEGEESGHGVLPAIRRGAMAVLEAADAARADRELQEAYRRIPQDPALIKAARRLAARTAPEW